MGKSNLILIGGSNIDYIGLSRGALVPHVSNIGTLNISFGGVMRNVAENLAYLKNPCVFLTAIGKDDLGKKMKERLKKEGVKVITPKTELPSSTYLAVHDHDHDLSVALCDNRIIQDLNPEFLGKKKDLIEKYPYIAIDTNLTQESVDYIFKTFPKNKILCETISPAKAVRLKKHLKEIFLLKGNQTEGQALSQTKEEGEALVARLLKKGAKNVVITHGGGDIFIGQATTGKVIRISNEPAKEIKNTTGCGDALFAGIIDKLSNGEDLIEAVKFGLKLAVLTLQSEKATSRDVRSLAYRHKN